LSPELNRSLIPKDLEMELVESDQIRLDWTRLDLIGIERTGLD
jgi:hypothetical protein